MTPEQLFPTRESRLGLLEHITKLDKATSKVWEYFGIFNETTHAELKGVAMY